MAKKIKVRTKPRTLRGIRFEVISRSDFVHVNWIVVRPTDGSAPLLATFQSIEERNARVLQFLDERAP